MKYLIVWLILSTGMFLLTQFYLLMLKASFGCKKLEPESYLYQLVKLLGDKGGTNISGVYTCNVSVSNAWLCGLFKPSIVLTNELVRKLLNAELNGIILHEIGHFKKGHIIKTLLIQIGVLGIITFLLSLTNLSLWIVIPIIIAAQYLFTRFYIPIEDHEFEADDFVKQHGLADGLHDALIKISKSDLTVRRCYRLKEYVVKNS